MELADKEGAEKREDSNSQLSLASQSSQIEPAVVLSSPNENSESTCVKRNDGEPLKSAGELNEGESGAVIDDDDNVFMEEPTHTADDGDKSKNMITSTNMDTAEHTVEEELISETNTFEKACPSPPMNVRSPEIPLQSSPSRTNFPLSPGDMEGNCRQSVRDSVSSDESAEMEVESDGTDTDSIGKAQDHSSLDHDHPYHCLGQQMAPSSVESQSSISAPLVTSAELADHSYCSTTTLASSLQTAVAPMSAMLQHESSGGHTMTDLRSKLSSDVQDHNYCRFPAPNTAQAADIVCEAEIGGDNGAEKTTQSQELFSVLGHDNELSSTEDNRGPINADPSPVLTTSADMGCQTDSIDLAQLITPGTPTDESIANCIKSVIDAMSSQRNLSTASLWKVHRELVRGLSVISDKLSSNAS